MEYLQGLDGLVDVKKVAQLACATFVLTEGIKYALPFKFSRPVVRLMVFLVALILCAMEHLASREVALLSVGQMLKESVNTVITALAAVYGHAKLKQMKARAVEKREGRSRDAPTESEGEGEAATAANSVTVEKTREVL